MTKIFIAGDSTAADYTEDYFPMHGWGQKLKELLEDIQVENRAKGGRSTKSFIKEGRLAEIESEIGEGDWLFIQFGHNDEHMDDYWHTDPFTTYMQYLKQCIETANKKGAWPVLLTPIARRRFDEQSNFIDTHGDYITAMKELAEEQNVPIIDMNGKTTKMIKELGQEESKKLFMWVEPNTYPAFPEGKKDDTHLNEQGADAVARFVAEGITENKLSLITYIKEII